MAEADQQHRLVESVAAGGLGLLTGTLLGLSVAQVVGGVIGALTALLAAFFGLSTASDQLRTDVLRATRIAAFAFACWIGVVLGLTARTHEWLGASVKTQVDAWVAAGATKPDALAYVAYGQLGIVPVNRTVAVIPAPPRNTPGLFANHGIDPCQDLMNIRFDTAAHRVQAMQQAGGAWGHFANSLTNLPPDELGKIADSGYQLVCVPDQ